MCKSYDPGNFLPYIEILEMCKDVSIKIKLKIKTKTV
jgi:hypothetical protein